MKKNRINCFILMFLILNTIILTILMEMLDKSDIEGIYSQEYPNGSTSYIILGKDGKASIHGIEAKYYKEYGKYYIEYDYQYTIYSDTEIHETGHSKVELEILHNGLILGKTEIYLKAN